MSRRRLIVSAAAVAAGVSLMPVPVLAAEPPAPGLRGGITAPQADTVANPTREPIFTSPADRTTPGRPDAADQKITKAEETPSIHLDGWPTSAHDVVLRADIESGGVPLDVTFAWGDGGQDTLAFDGSGYVDKVHKYAEVGEYAVTVTATDPASGARYVNKVVMTTAGSDFTPHSPLRLLDTREGLGEERSKVHPDDAATVRVRGRGSIPDSVTHVVVNLTATNAVGAGHISAPGSVHPSYSSVINYAQGETVANLAVVPVNRHGDITLINEGWGSVDLIADVTGYFSTSPSSGYVSLSPARIVDTRQGLGAAKRQLAGQGSLRMQIGGANGVPRGATAVSLNITVTNPREAGHLTVHPSDQQTPTTSNLNFTAGQTVANSVIVPVGRDGEIVVRNGSWKPTDVVIDINGYYTPDSGATFVSQYPGRQFDTRQSGRPVAARDVHHVPYEVDLRHIEAYVLNTTVTNTSGPGFLSVTTSNGPVAPTPQERPTSSALNWTADRTVANLTQVRPGKGITYWNQGWESIDLIVDYYGSYQTN
ncbi:PKD domain-containing protein [Streptomyces sp. NPDC055254]